MRGERITSRGAFPAALVGPWRGGRVTFHRGAPAGALGLGWRRRAGGVRLPLVALRFADRVEHLGAWGVRVTGTYAGGSPRRVARLGGAYMADSWAWAWGCPARIAYHGAGRYLFGVRA